MRIFVLRISLLLGVCLLSACSTVSVSTDYDHSAPFASYRTYSLAPPVQGQMLSPTSEAALRDALRMELAKRGLAEAQGGKGDVAIARHVFTKDKVSVQQYTDWGYGYGPAYGPGGYWPYRYGSYGMWAGAPRTYVNVNQYTEGTMILDFVDTQRNRLVFRATGQAVVGDAAENANSIREAVAMAVAKWPTAAVP